MFEFSQLRCFLAVAEDLHFGRAAQRMNMTQPPLSRQIQLLEHELGVTLFERTSRAVKMTPAGRTFLPEAKQMLRLAEGAIVSAKRVARGEVGPVTLGFTPDPATPLFRDLSRPRWRKCPMSIWCCGKWIPRIMMEALAAGRLDAGAVRLPVDRRGMELACVMREQMLLAVPEGHALANGNAPNLRDLERIPFIMYSPTEGRYFYDLTSGILRAAEIEPSYVQHVSEVHTALALVSVGMGLALVPQAARNLGVQGVVLRDLRPVPRTLAELYMVWRKGQDNPAFRVFRNLVLPKLIDI